MHSWIFRHRRGLAALYDLDRATPVPDVEGVGTEPVGKVLWPRARRAGPRAPDADPEDPRGRPGDED